MPEKQEKFAWLLIYLKSEEFLEKKEFSNENPFILEVGEGSNSILHLRGARERYPDNQLTRNKCVLGRNTIGICPV